MAVGFFFSPRQNHNTCVNISLGLRFLPLGAVFNSIVGPPYWHSLFMVRPARA